MRAGVKTPGGAPKRTPARIDNASDTGKTERMTPDAPQLGRVEGVPAGVPRRALHSGFLSSRERFPERPALEVDDVSLTYAELHARAAAIAAVLDRAGVPDEPPLTAVYAYRTAAAYAGVLGALYRGHGYVPLNRTFPPERTAALLRRVGCRALVVDEASATHLDTVLEAIDKTLALVLPDVDDVSAIAARWPKHIVIGAQDLLAPADWEPRDAAPDAIAYLLFTSGSTGVPKGVMVSHANVGHFLDVMLDRYGIDENDRLSQTFDMTFDLSVFDMFMAWERGACVCCLPQAALLQPARFIHESRLTVWFSVPSLALLMRRLGMLKPDRYPTLRWSLFCGEPLPVAVANAWAEAAPSSIVENLYGPTELTIACTLYRWERERGTREARFGIVPIGTPYPGMTALVADADLRPVEPSGEGELLLSGPQVTLGYWHDEEKTRAAFVRPPGATELHYRTGDLVRAPVGDEPLLYVGRIDNQIKVNGYRVELGEVEQALREASGADEVVALGWPRTESGASGVAAFVQGAEIDAEALRGALAETLPYYMVPRTITAIEEFPLNANGKHDRNALVLFLEAQA